MKNVTQEELNEYRSYRGIARMVYGVFFLLCAVGYAIELYKVIWTASIVVDGALLTVIVIFIEEAAKWAKRSMEDFS